MKVSGGTIMCSKVRSHSLPIIVYAMVPYDSINHQYFRIRYERGTDRVYCEASGDGTIWTSLGSTAQVLSINLTAVHIVLGGSVSNVTHPEQVIRLSEIQSDAF
jgi:hypothetical protein